MARRGVKRPQLRRGSDKLGVARRGPRGELIMDFFEATDNGTAPEIYVTNVSRIERIGEGTVRVSYYSRRREGNPVVLDVIWDIQELLEAFERWAEARDEIVADINAGDGHIGRERGGGGRTG